MKKFFLSLFGLFCKKNHKTTTTTTKQVINTNEITSPSLEQVYPHNVNGVEQNIEKICNSGVLTIFSDCQNLTMGCYVCFDSNAKDFETLSGKYFHDYMNDTVFYVREGDGMIMNVGKCRS